MKEQLITFKVAKLAKEKGFNWEVYYSYDERVELAEYAKNFNLDTDEVVDIRLDHLKIDFNGISNNFISAPTQSLLQKWLREVHNIHIQIFFINNSFRVKVKYFYKDMIMSLPITRYAHKTYEEALEKGLLEGLIKIKKQNNDSKI